MTQLLKIPRCIDKGVVFRHLQRAMDISVLMEPPSNSRQHGLDFVVAGARRGQRYKTDCGSKFIVDPMIQLVQKYSFLQHDVLLIHNSFAE